jgi:hypothetical protein
MKVSVYDEERAVTTLHTIKPASRPMRSGRRDRRRRAVVRGIAARKEAAA